MGLDLNNMGGQSNAAIGYPTVGTQAARLVQIVDKGIQPRMAYQGTAKSPCQQVALTFELGNDMMMTEEGPKPRWLSRTYNCFTGQNADLPAVIAVLDPTGQHGGRLGSLVGSPVFLDIRQKTDKATGAPKEGVYIAGVSLPMVGYPVPELVNAPRVFDFDAPDPEVFKQLPAWLQNDIKSAHNYPGSAVETMVNSLGLASPQQAAPQQAAPVQVVTQQAAPVQAAPAQVVTQQAAPQQTAPVQVVQSAPVVQQAPAQEAPVVVQAAPVQAAPVVQPAPVVQAAPVQQAAPIQAAPVVQTTPVVVQAAPQTQVVNGGQVVPATVAHAPAPTQAAPAQTNIPWEG